MAGPSLTEIREHLEHALRIDGVAHLRRWCAKSFHNRRGVLEGPHRDVSNPIHDQAVRARDRSMARSDRSIPSIRSIFEMFRNISQYISKKIRNLGFFVNFDSIDSIIGLIRSIIRSVRVVDRSVNFLFGVFQNVSSCIFANSVM